MDYTPVRDPRECEAIFRWLFNACLAIDGAIQWLCNVVFDSALTQMLSDNPAQMKQHNTHS